MARTHDRSELRTAEEIAAQLGVHVKTFHDYRRDPVMSRHIYEAPAPRRGRRYAWIDDPDSQESPDPSRRGALAGAA
jgi:hypothetical protein